MSIISKEGTEVANSGAESAASASLKGARSQPAPGQFHADAVSLEVPIKIHGSRVIDAARGGQTEPFEEQCASMIVFPNGGVLRMSTAVSAGQMLVVTNLKSRQDAICRVIKVRTYSGSASYVEVEFTHRQSGYWGVYFESDSAAEPAKDAASPVPSRSSLPGGSAANTAPVGQPGSAFAPIGSHEDVQPPASMTASSPIAPPARTVKPLPISTAQKSAAADAPASPPPVVPPAGDALASSAHISKLDDEAVSISEETLSEAPRSGAASPNASRYVRSSGALFGASLDSAGREGQGSATGKNWLLIAACAAGLVVAAGGGYLLLHHHSAPGISNTTQAVAQPEQPVVAQPAQPPAATEERAKSKPASISVNPVRGNSATVSTAPPKETVASAAQPEQPSQPAGKPTAGTSVPSMFGTLNAHPISTRQSAQGPSAAPALDAGTVSPGETNALQGITSGAAGAALPPPSPEFQPSGPLPVGGRVKEPQIVSRTLPVYPQLARQARTEGDVVLQIVVDRTGSVSAMSVVSGPPTLRKAALDAVRRWKYKPSVLAGEPVAVQMQVTIQFRL